MSDEFARRTLRWAALGLLLVIVVLPRFNLRDAGPIAKFTAGATATQYGLPLDVAGYVRLGQYFRHEMPADSLIPPYCYRLLVPIAASALPWSVLTSINVLDVVSLLLAFILLDRLMRRMGLSIRASTMGIVLFVVSFPTFYYGPIGFLDPVCVMLITAMLLAIIEVGPGGGVFTGLFVVGVLVKETNAAMALLPSIWAAATARPMAPAIRRTTILVAVALAILIAIRLAAPFPSRGWFWAPHITAVLENLTRPRAIISLVLTLGLPAIGMFVALLNGAARRTLAEAHIRFLVWGAAIPVSLYLYSLFSAYADGRIIWALYPFAIPIAATLWSRPTATTAA